MIGANELLLAKLTLHSLTTVALVWGLIYYELHRKWDKVEAEARGMMKLVAIGTRYRVALIIFCIVVPNWADVLPKLFGASTN